jgi:hypothetical protein
MENHTLQFCRTDYARHSKAEGVISLPVIHIKSGGQSITIKGSQ